MKEKRHKAILEIIGQRAIETQEELARELGELGFCVTQATISREIKELHLIKVQAEHGIYKYAVNEASATLNAAKLLRVFRETVLSVRPAGNLAVIHTLTGSASAAAEVIDSLEIEGVVGCIAGDNTIFVAVEGGDRAVQRVTGVLQNMMR